MTILLLPASIPTPFLDTLPEPIVPGLAGLGLLRQEAGMGELLTLFVPWILIFGIFYFIAIRPARIKQQQLAQQIDQLKKGDKVVTTGGIHGEVAGVSDRTLILEIADDVKIRILKSGIAGLEGETDGSNR